MRHQKAEVGFKFAHEEPCQCNLHNNRHKKESRVVLETEHVDNDFGKKDDDKHKDGEEAAEREHHPEALPGPVVVGKHCLDHGEEGDAHGSNNKDVEFQPKTVEVIFVHKPIKSHQQDSLDDQLSKGLCDCF